MATTKKIKKDDAVNLSQNLEQLEKIASWFDDQSELDIELGMAKVKEAAILIKESKSRLKDIENEFTEIKKDIEEDNV